MLRSVLSRAARHGEDRTAVFWKRVSIASIPSGLLHTTSIRMLRHNLTLCNLRVDDQKIELGPVDPV